MKTVIEMARAKPIPSAPGYWVDEIGEVYNHRGRRMAQQVTAKGYCRVHLQINGEPKSKTVHSLVADSFIGPRPKGLQVRHLDGNKANNHLINLAYGTAKENEADKVLHGTKATGCKNGAHTKPESRPRGSRHGLSVLDEETVKKIKTDLAEMPSRSGALIAKKYSVSISTVCLIRNEKIWRHV